MGTFHLTSNIGTEVVGYKFRSMYPDLNTFRRIVVPIFEQNEESWFGKDIMFSKKGQNRTYTGVIVDRTVADVVEELQSMENVYSRNLAALKWRETQDGERVYERASYAYVPNGFFGEYQYHVRLWPHEDGVAVWAHYELNPWVRPRDHYNGVDWNPQKGKEWAKNTFDIDESKNMSNVTK